MKPSNCTRCNTATPALARIDREPEWLCFNCHPHATATNPEAERLSLPKAQIRLLLRPLESLASGALPHLRHVVDDHQNEGADHPLTEVQWNALKEAATALRTFQAAASRALETL